jgi:hypothetical protein
MVVRTLPKLWLLVREWNKGDNRNLVSAVAYFDTGKCPAWICGYLTFITISLLQNARTMAGVELFGDPAINVFFANGLVEKIRECGINVKVLTKDWKQVLRMLERVVLFLSDLTRKK